MRLKYTTVVQKQSFRTLRKDEKNNRKRGAESHPKPPKMEALGDLGLDFWEAFENIFLGRFFDRQKVS